MTVLNKKPNMSLILAGLLAIVAGFMVWVILKSQAPTVPVVVAISDIAVGQVIDESMIEVQNYPASMVPGNTCRDKGQVVGQIVAYGPVIKGGMVFIENLTNGGTLQARLCAYAPVKNDYSNRPVLNPGDWVAIELPDEAGLRGLTTGDFIDIYGERPQSANSMDVDIIIPHAMVIDTPDEACPRYTIAVERQYAEAAAEIKVRKMNVALVLAANQPVIGESPGDSAKTASGLDTKTNASPDTLSSGKENQSDSGMSRPEE